MDYDIESPSFLFDGSTSSGDVKCVLVDIIEDSIFECPETFEVNLLAPANVIELGPSALVYIKDNEGNITDII